MGAENSTLQNAGGCSSSTNCRTCKDFGGSRPTDTVKVDLDKLQQQRSASDKENADPGQRKEKPLEKEKTLEKVRAAEEEQARIRYEEQMERRRKEAEKAKQRAEEERLRRQAEEEKEAEEEKLRRLKELRLKQEEEARKKIAEQKAAEDRGKKLQAEQERLRRLQAEEEARLRAQEEEARQLEEARSLREEVAMTKKLLAFLEKAGFEAPNHKKVKKGMVSTSWSYPLHLAAEQNDAEFVELLLWAGADRKLPNSKKQTPLQVARAKNSKTGSYTKVIAMLCV